MTGKDRLHANNDNKHWCTQTLMLIQQWHHCKCQPEGKTIVPQCFSSGTLSMYGAIFDLTKRCTVTLTLRAMDELGRSSFSIFLFTFLFFYLF